MILYVTVPSEGSMRGEIFDFIEAARAAMRARGIALIWHRVHDRPTMACRNRQAMEFLDSPADLFLSLDSDCIPTDRETGRPDTAGLLRALDLLARDDVDVLFGWSLILREANRDLVPCVVRPLGADPSQPRRWPLDFVSPYATAPVEITGGGAGTHCFFVKRRVFAAMRDAGRLPFEDVHERDASSESFGGRVLGHDLAFCALAADLGFRLWLDPRLCWGHSKDIDLRWFHDVVLGMSNRVAAHVSVAGLLRAPGDLPPQVLLLVAEEAARISDDACAACAPDSLQLRICQWHVGDRALPLPFCRDSHGVSLFVLRSGDGLPDVRKARGAVLIYEGPEDAPVVRAFCEGMNVVSVESVSGCTVVRCGV